MTISVSPASASAGHRAASIPPRNLPAIAASPLLELMSRDPHTAQVSKILIGKNMGEHGATHS